MEGGAGARVHLATGILERDGALLLVASRYPNHREPLWNLPGGRQRPGELVGDALVREFLEETGLAIERGPLAYVAESYDRATSVHFVNFAFEIAAARYAASGEPLERAVALVAPKADAHVVELAWIPRADIAKRLKIAVVREPLLGYLSDEPKRYFSFDDAGITIEFADPA